MSLSEWIISHAGGQAMVYILVTILYHLISGDLAQYEIFGGASESQLVKCGLLF